MEQYLLTAAFDYIFTLFSNNHNTFSQFEDEQRTTKMKLSLTENGVLKLYSQNGSTRPKLQVLFLCQWKLRWFLRLSDGKYLSPVVMLIDMNKKLSVGAIISVKQVVYYTATGVIQYEDLIPIIDPDVAFLIIREYQVEVAGEEIDKVLGVLQTDAAYWSSLLHVKLHLIKQDPTMEQYFTLEEKRLKFLKSDCNMLRQRGNEFFNRNDYYEAIIHYDAAKQKDHFDHRVWCNSSQAHLKNQEYSAAEVDAIITLKLTPFNNKGYYRAAQAAKEQQKISEASEYVRAGLLLCGSCEDLLKLQQNLIDETVDDTIVIMSANGEKSSNITAAIQQELNLLDVELVGRIIEEKHKQDKEPGICDNSKNSATTTLKTTTTSNLKATTTTTTTTTTMTTKTNILKNIEFDKDKKPSLLSEKTIVANQNATKKASPCGPIRSKSSSMSKSPSDSTTHDIEKYNNDNSLDKVEPCNHEYVEVHPCMHNFVQVDNRNHRFVEIPDHCCHTVREMKPKQSKIKLMMEGSRRFYEKEDYEYSSHFMEDIIANHPDDKNILIYKFLDCLFKVNFKCGKKAENTIETLLSFVQSCSNFPSPAAAHRVLAQAYFRTRQYEKISHHIKACLRLLNNGPITPILWPILKDPILETTHESVAHWIREGSWRIQGVTPGPVARCRHSNCLASELSNLSKQDIYTDEPSFRGYVDIGCEELCTITYHINCWKAVKKHHEANNAAKITDKDFLGLQCLTPDCSGKIVNIRIFDENTQLKDEFPKDKKDKVISQPTKQKKKKEKKKEKCAASRSEDRKRNKNHSVNEESEDNSLYNERIKGDGTNKNNSANSSISKVTKGPPVPSYLVDLTELEESEFTILKPELSMEETEITRTSKKNKKKKKKKGGAAGQNDLLADPFDEDNNIQNDYLNRLRSLKQQRDAQESENIVSSSNKHTNVPTLPQNWYFDPDKPFYFPEHLQGDLEQLEKILQTKMVMATSPNLTQDTITTLLDFMYDWLKSEGPMFAGDARLREYITENFPPEGASHVQNCGGPKGFLLQSIKFALIDDYICTRDQVLQTQEVVLQNSLETFKSPKYLISDGHHAQKLGHLIDEEKSTCSSTSSYSTSTSQTFNNKQSANINGVPKSPSNTTNVSLNTNGVNGIPKSSSNTSNVLSSNTDNSVCYVAKISVNGITKQGSINDGLTTHPSSTTNNTGTCPSKVSTTTNGETNDNSLVNSALSKKAKKTLNRLDSFENSSQPPTQSPNSNSNIKSPFKCSTPSKEPGKLIGGPSTNSNSKNDKERCNNIFEDLGDAEVGKLFKLTGDLGFTPPNKSKVLNLSKNKRNPNNSMTASEMDELDNFDDDDDDYESEEMQIMREEVDAVRKENDQLLIRNQVLANQNEELNDRMLQMKTRTSVEINSLKKELEEAIDQRQTADTSLEWLRSQREGDNRRINSEKNKLQEEIKTLSSRLDSLQLSFDQTWSSNKELLEELGQKSIALTKQQDTVHLIEQSLSSTADRARQAEFKYLCTKKDIVTSYQNKIANRLNMEMSKLRQLIPMSSEDTTPNKTTLIKTITDWGNYIDTIYTTVETFEEDSKRLLTLLGSGRPLGAINDLTVPVLLDYSLVDLIHVGQVKLNGLGCSSLPIPTSCMMAPNMNCNSALPTGLSSLNNNNRITTSLNNCIMSNSNNLGLSSLPPFNSLSLGGLSLGTAKSDAPPNYLLNSVTQSQINNIPTLSPSHPSGISVLTSLSGGGVKPKCTNSTTTSPAPSSSSSSTSSSSTTTSSAVLPEVLLTDDRDKLLSGSTFNFSPHSGKDCSILNKAPGSGQKSSPLIPLAGLGNSVVVPARNMSSTPSSNSTSSAYGLGDITANALEASKAATRTLPTPTTPTVTKPKFQNLRSSHNVGAIGTLPPKLVRPQPRQPSNNSNSMVSMVVGSGSASGGGGSILKDGDSVTSSASYKRLIEECKQRCGSENSLPEIHKAIRDVRENNKNSLSGLSVEMIIERVQCQLRGQSNNNKPSIAPWAKLTQGKDLGLGWQGPLKIPDGVSEDQCSICLEQLDKTAMMPLPCQHVFHVSCIKPWLKLKSDCPICRNFTLMNDEYPSLSHSA